MSELTEGTPSDFGGREGALQAASCVWTGQLVDLSARNNLLFYKDLKVGTLDLSDVEDRHLFEVLAGRTVRLTRLFPAEDERPNAVRRARAVRNRAQEHFEERGLETLFLACGMATWTNQRGTATPCAPVLLAPAHLLPHGAAQDEFEVSVTGDLEVNPTFLQYLATEYDCDIDPEELLSMGGIAGAIDTPDEFVVVFDWLTDRCQAVAGFGVSARFVLGTFSYAKLPMVKDLEGSVEAMVAHDLVAALAGDELARAAVRERRARVDPKSPNSIPPADEFLVLDADASQNYAINAVLAGQDLVIKGPPGTGKSQTIANLISTLVARGKRVLFVAEKRAAIDAVLHRLNDNGLGDVVLDLHGGASSRRVVAQALAKSLNTNATITRPDRAQLHSTLTSRRDELNRRVEALHSRRAPWDLSVFDAQTRLLGMDVTASTPVRLRGAMLERLDALTFAASRENLRAYVGMGGLTLASSGSPWAAAEVVSAEKAADAQTLVERLHRQTLPYAERSLRAATAATGLSVPSSLAGWEQRLALWEKTREVLATFDPALLAEDLDALGGHLAPLSAGVGKRAAATLSSSEFRASRRLVKSHLRAGISSSAGNLHAAMTAAGQLKRDWRELAAVDKTDRLPVVPDALEDLRSTYEQLTHELGQVSELIQGNLLNLGHAEAVTTLEALLRDTVTLGKLPELYRLRSALQNAGLGELLDDFSARQLAPDSALAAFDHAWLWSFLEHVRLTDPLIGAFDGDQHLRTVAEFAEADRTHIQTTAQRVRRLCAEQAVRSQDEEPEQNALIKDQAARKRKHLSVRQLFSAAPEALLALKPCWAMSPLLVSQLLPADRQYFDVVVFDEASQVRPADAIPAILRGKRLVVAGDEKQLPPTDFFTGSNPEVDAPELEGRIVVDGGYESILEALLPFIDFRMLRWHYRSRDERLIAFSNLHLYDRQLVTFPGVTGPDAVQHVHVPFEPDPMAGESSAAEVERVVDLVVEHAEERPDESLGVITMGIKHADRIEAELRSRLADRRDLATFFDESRPERFFIKNLERVQGDERDAIILSVGYGKNADGRLMYRFGPLNQEGGERRLNVAITRAKNSMTIVSAFTHEDMDPGRSSARGVELLRLYLQYTASHGENIGERPHDIPELNAFEVDVRDALVREGISVVAQYGSSGFRIDFAAQHPTSPGRMVLAIECDGATYHSSETARDRDRLRQQILEGLGWTFHRIWSQDWFQNKEREIVKAVCAYEHAVAVADGEATPHVASEVMDGNAAVNLAALPAAAAAAGPTRGPRPAVPRRRSIAEYDEYEIRNIVRWVESDTLLRSQEQLLDATMRELGFARRGSRIVDAITQAIAAERLAAQR